MNITWPWKRKTTTQKIADAIDKVPLAIIAGLTGFSLVAIILVLIGQFKTEFIWLFGPIVAGMCVWVIVRFANVERPGATKAKLICDIVVLLGVLVWGGYNMMYSSQHVLTNRDPATYAVAAAWLAERDSLRIDIPATAKSVEGLTAGSAGFAVDRDTKDTVYAQAQHILPALLGSVGKIVGPKHLLHFNVLFGMTALPFSAPWFGW